MRLVPDTSQAIVSPFEVEDGTGVVLERECRLAVSQPRSDFQHARGAAAAAATIDHCGISAIPPQQQQQEQQHNRFKTMKIVSLVAAATMSLFMAMSSFIICL